MIRDAEEGSLLGIGDGDFYKCGQTGPAGRWSVSQFSSGVRTYFGVIVEPNTYVFGGASVSAVLGIGGTVGAGLYESSYGESGTYVKIGLNFGLGGGVSGEGGVTQSLGGKGLSLCVGAVLGGGCASFDTKKGYVNGVNVYAPGKVAVFSEYSYTLLIPAVRIKNEVHWIK